MISLVPNTPCFIPGIDNLCLLSYFFFISLDRGFSIFLIFTENQFCVSLFFSFAFKFFNFIDTCSFLLFLLFHLGLFCSFCRFLEGNLKWLIWDFSFSLTCAFSATCFSLGATFAISYKFSYVVFSSSFSSIYFLKIDFIF